MRRITVAEAQSRLNGSQNLSARFAPSREVALRDYALRLERSRVVGGPGSDDTEGEVPQADESGDLPDVLSEEEKINIAAAVAELGEEEAAEIMGLETTAVSEAAAEQAGNSLVRGYVEERLFRARKKGSSKLLKVLNAITDEKISKLGAKDAAAVAKDLSTVVTKLDEKKDDRKVIVIGEFRAPTVSYPAIDIKAEPLQ